MKKLKAQASKGSSYSKGLSRGTVSTKERLLAPDLGRGFMLLIIALAHAPLWLNASETNLMGMPAGGSIIDEVINFFSILLVDNRGLPLFAVLLGYGLTMMIDRQLSAGTSVAEAKRLLRRRGLFLLLFGFVHAVIIGGIDILAFYGFATLIIGWLLFRKNHILNRAILSVAIVFLFLLPIVWVSMANMMEAAGTGMEFQGTLTSTSYLETTLLNLIGFPFMIFAQLFMYPMLLPIIIGIWAGRKKLFEGKPDQLTKIAILGITISIIGGLPLALDGTLLWNSTPTMEGIFTALQMITGLAGGIGYAAIFGLIGSIARRTSIIVKSLTALGQRSLTFYLFIETMLVILLSPVMLGLGQMLNIAGAVVVAVILWLISLFLAMRMEDKGVRGPADVLLRKLIYRR